jgi:membrane protein implicated in regulation of membrane protease activity
MSENQAPIAEYKSLREEHIKNMEMRGTLTNIMVAALAAIIGIGSWSQNSQTPNAFYIFFFVPGLTAGWALMIYHSYRVFQKMCNYLAKLELTLGMHWNEQNPPQPALWGYVLVLLGAVFTSTYFLNVLPQPADITGICLFMGTWKRCLPVSTLCLGWMIWLAGVVLSVVMSVLLVCFWFEFREKKKGEEKRKEGGEKTRSGVTMNPGDNAGSLPGDPSHLP